MYEVKESLGDPPPPTFGVDSEVSEFHGGSARNDNSEAHDARGNAGNDQP